MLYGHPGVSKSIWTGPAPRDARGRFVKRYTEIVCDVRDRTVFDACPVPLTPAQRRLHATLMRGFIRAAIKTLA